MLEESSYVVEEAWRPEDKGRYDVIPKDAQIRLPVDCGTAHEVTAANLSPLSTLNWASQRMRLWMK